MQIKDSKSFGIAIRAYRKRQNATQSQLAAVSNTDQRFISALENGAPGASLDKALRVAWLVGLRFDAKIEPNTNSKKQPLPEQILRVLENAPENMINTSDLISELGMDSNNTIQMRKFEQALRYLIEKMFIESNYKNTTGFVFGAGDSGTLINMRTFMLTPAYLRIRSRQEAIEGLKLKGADR